MIIIENDSYRSEGRKINQNDDMVRLVLDMKMHEYFKLIEILKKGI